MSNILRSRSENVSSCDKKIILIPACPTIQLTRKKSITPQIFSKHLTKTPLIHPNFIDAPSGAVAALTSGVPVGDCIIIEKKS